MSDLVIRRLTPDEWKVFREVRLAALADAPGAFWSTLEREKAYNEQEWRSRLGPERVTAAAFLDGLPVGVAVAEKSEDIENAVQLGRMWVSAAARGTGAASMLVDEVNTWARENDYPIVELCITQGNDRAAAFYEREGFEYTGVTWPHNRDDSLCYLQMTRPVE